MNKQLRWPKLWISIILVLLSWVVSGRAADVSPVWLPSIFADNMVLQRDKPIAIWGTATPGLPVRIKLGSNEIDTIPGINGNWSATLPAMPAGGSYELSMSGSNHITFHNVAIGDVWFCAGQSNMQMPLSQVHHSDNDFHTANYPMLRFFQMKSTPSFKIEKDISGNWQTVSPLTISRFSAVAYYFARETYLKTKIPIVVIECSSGGTIKFWMSKDSLSNNPKDPLSAYASMTFNGMVAPLIGFGIKGLIWYKGETDPFDALKYEKLLSSLVQDWRQKWGMGNFPILCVQLPNHPGPYNCSIDSAFAQIREAQLKCSKSIPNFHLIVTIDTAEKTAGVHPKNKAEIGHRLAQISLSKIYGYNLSADSPLYQSIHIQRNKVRIHFSPAGLSPNHKELNGFLLAGTDQIFYPANAQVAANSSDVTAWSNRVTNPVAVRYAWADNPECNLFGKNGLPVSPFRSDSWTPASFIEAQTASYWLKKAYLAQKDLPNIVVLGSEQLFALFGADAYVYHKAIDITGDHRSYVLERNLLGLLDRHLKVIVGALPGGMISDQLIISHALFANPDSPNLVAITLSPRNFIDANCSSIDTTEPAMFFFKNNPNLNLFLSDHKNNSNWYIRLSSFFCKQFKIFNLNNRDYQHNKNENTNNFSSLSWDSQFKRIYPGSLIIKPTDGYVFHDNLEEYRKRYCNPFSTQLHLQMDCLDALLSYLIQKKIKVVVFDLPITNANRQLLSDNFWQFYNKQISKTCKKYGADYINIDNDLKAFTDNDFMDSIHLNLPGSLKLTTTIALYIANKLHLKTFAELQANEYKML